MPSPESPANRTTAFLMSTSGRGTAESVIVLPPGGKNRQDCNPLPRAAARFRNWNATSLRDAQYAEQAANGGSPRDRRASEAPPHPEEPIERERDQAAREGVPGELVGRQYEQDQAGADPE